MAEVNQRCCFEEMGQWLENVDQSHLPLTSGKLVLQNLSANLEASNERLNCKVTNLAENSQSSNLTDPRRSWLWLATVLSGSNLMLKRSL